MKEAQLPEKGTAVAPLLLGVAKVKPCFLLEPDYGSRGSLAHLTLNSTPFLLNSKPFALPFPVTLNP